MEDDVVTENYKKLKAAITFPDKVGLKQDYDRYFTKIKDTDILILEKLSDEDLINICQTSRYVNSLCNDEEFWHRRSQSRFTDADLDKKQNFYEAMSWKDYYLTRSDWQVREAWLKSQTEYKEYLLFPVIISRDMKRFLMEADLGVADPSDPTSEFNRIRLQDVLLIKRNVSTTFILTRLLEIYFYLNDEFCTKELYRTTELKKYFKNIDDCTSIGDLGVLIFENSESFDIPRNEKLYEQLTREQIYVNKLFDFYLEHI